MRTGVSKPGIREHQPASSGPAAALLPGPVSLLATDLYQTSLADRNAQEDLFG